MKSNFKIMTIVGTRPEIIKLSRVISELDTFSNHILVHSGQNYDYELNEIFFNDLGIRKPNYFLESVGENLADTIGNIITKGEFIGGIREGSWFYNINDHKEEGEFRDGLKNGIWIYTYNDGQINFKGEYINGLPMDKHRFYYPNGQLKWEGKYDNGEKEGEWKKFNEEGLIILTIQYKRGVEYKVDGYKIKPAFETQ
jgi:antitoxin component YwqK of YwqJK toxin-antitoxin module